MALVCYFVLQKTWRWTWRALCLNAFPPTDSGWRTLASTTVTPAWTKTGYDRGGGGAGGGGKHFSIILSDKREKNKLHTPPDGLREDIGCAAKLQLHPFTTEAGDSKLNLQDLS